MGDGMKDDSKQLTIISLCALLERIQRDHGDLPVVIDDADTNWHFLLRAGHLQVVDSKNAFGKKLTIGCQYADEVDHEW